MKITSVVFPTDFSETNEAALQYASALASDSGATLHIVHVQDTRTLNPSMGEATSLYADAWQRELAASRALLDGVRPTTPGVTYQQHSLVGPPDAEIVEFAKTCGADLIVMASHGRTGISRLLMGSVAEAVMRRAPCPVLVVKQPATDEERKEYEASSSAQAKLLS